MKRTVLVRALSIAFSAGALAAAVTPAAMAQSNASGVIFGTVTTPAGASVLMTNTDTGLKRTITPESTGRFQATAMPQGHYTVELQRDGKTESTTSVDVLVGQGVEATFTTAGVQAVQVRGHRSSIDVSTANNGSTFTASQLAALPIAQSVDAIIQLAPNTTRADPRYAAGASIGGGGASENSYYINGFPVTNPLTQLGASELPFGAISQAQILTGGFGAEFGRSVGGVINITTKSGTNTWEAGAQYSIEPNSTRANAKDVYYAKNGTALDGQLYSRNSQDTEVKSRYGAYVGGPIIKDKLFMFFSAEQVKDNVSGVNGTSDETSTNGSIGWKDDKNTTTRYLGKFDWNINDNNRLEWTTIGDRPVTDTSLSDYNYVNGVHNENVSATAHYQSIANQTPTIGAKTNILKYTGNLTDDLTVTGLIGKSKTEHRSELGGYNASNPQVSVLTNADGTTGAAPALGNVYGSQQPYTGRIASPYSYDEVKSQRLDLEYKLDKHTIRAGFDNNKLSSYEAGEEDAGGVAYSYRYNPNTTGFTGGGTTIVTGNGSALGNQGYYVIASKFSDITAAFSDQSAQYIEDRYQATQNLVMTFGLRQDEYKNKNGLGQTFLKVKNMIDPRFSASWDVNGDATTKVYGSAGRYSLQIPTHIAVRGASVSTLTSQYYTYTGVSANGTPTGLVALSQPFSSDNEYGQPKLYQTVAAQNLKPIYQDEVTLGFEHVQSPNLTFGVKGTYRTLRSTIDDFCDPRPFYTWATAHNVDTTNWGGFGCASINPGKTNNFLVDFAGTGTNLTPVTLTAKDMGFDKAKRTYAALDFFAEHPMRDGWYGRINYTFARSAGNTEGQTLSSVAQTDVAATQTWDHREIMENADGLLPNDRKHQIKAFGVYNWSEQLSFGGNLLMASGQPESCIGNYPDSLIANDPGFADINYGSAYHYCNGVAAVQGGAGRLPWDFRLDADVVFKPEQVKGMSFKLDIFNVFNKQTVQQVDEQYNSGDQVSSTYGTPGAFLGYTAPRSMKFTVEYNHKF